MLCVAVSFALSNLCGLTAKYLLCPAVRYDFRAEIWNEGRLCGSILNPTKGCIRAYGRPFGRKAQLVFLICRLFQIGFVR